MTHGLTKKQAAFFSRMHPDSDEFIEAMYENEFERDYRKMVRDHYPDAFYEGGFPPAITEQAEKSDNDFLEAKLALEKQNTAYALPRDLIPILYLYTELFDVARQVAAHYRHGNAAKFEEAYKDACRKSCSFFRLHQATSSIEGIIAKIKSFSEAPSAVSPAGTAKFVGIDGKHPAVKTLAASAATPPAAPVAAATAAAAAAPSSGSATPASAGNAAAAPALGL